MDPPPYSETPAFNFDSDEKIGLLDSHRTSQDHSPPAHEINLDDVDEGVEMMERSHEPFINYSQGYQVSGSDVEMAEGGDSQHLEHAGEK